MIVFSHKSHLLNDTPTIILFSSYFSALQWNQLHDCILLTLLSFFMRPQDFLKETHQSSLYKNGISKQTAETCCRDPLDQLTKTTFIQHFMPIRTNFFNLLTSPIFESIKSCLFHNFLLSSWDAIHYVRYTKLLIPSPVTQCVNPCLKQHSQI